VVTKKSSFRFRSPIRLSFLLVTCAIVLALATAGGLAQKSRKISGPARSISGGSEKVNGKNKTTRGSNRNTNRLTRTSSGSNLQDPVTGETVGVPTIGEMGIQRTTAEIMQAQAVAPPSSRPLMAPEREIEGREERPQNPNAPAVASLPELGAGANHTPGNSVQSLGNLLTPSAPQIVGTNFNAVTGPTETGAFPPDTMGAVGPSQVFLFVNGRMRTFNKTTGAADGFINVDPDVFFASAMTPVSPPVVLNFTSDPKVRYDRL
jgi:hypothetical protein